MSENEKHLNKIINSFNNEDLCMQANVSITQGHKILVNNAHNHFVDAGLKQILALLISGNMLKGSWNVHFYFPSYNGTWCIYLGTDINTATTPTMTALTAPIGNAPGTAPNIKDISSIHDGGGDGDWYAIYQATWNANTISGTVGEAALYMVDCLKTAFRWQISSSTQTTPHMFSRLSVKDGDFSSFVIDTDLPLTVEWKLRFFFG